MSGQPSTQWIPMQSGPRGYSKPGATASFSEVASDEAGLLTDEAAPHLGQTFQQKFFGGTKRTLRTFLSVAIIVLIVNVSWLGTAIAKYGIKDGFGTIRRGECEAVKSLNTWLHFLINVLSTLLLTASNAFMTVYCCPSREEVNTAHRQGKSLHVGSFSFSNLRGIAKRKGLVVLVLALSSAPFHLLYNSLVFTSLATNQYYWSVVSEDFLSGAPFNLTGDWGPRYYNDSIVVPFFTATPPNGSFGDVFDLDLNGRLNLNKVMYDYFDNTQQSAPSWERLENKDCIKAYENVFISSRRSVVLVSSSKNETNSIMMYGSADFQPDLDENWWICSEGGQDGGYMTCNPEKYISSATSWTIFGKPIEYCLSDKSEDFCSIEFSQTIMFVVIAFNGLKVLVMLWVLLRFDAEKILATVGDAAASFLISEDQSTHMMCLANKRQMRKFWQSRGLARPFDRRRHRWGEAVSKKRWILFFCLMIFAFSAVAFFGTWGFVHVKDQGVSLGIASLWNLGFGTLHQNALLIYGGGGNVITNAILANAPQVILAVIYLLYMGIMTSMFLAVDWSKFAFKQQTLMVSNPAGQQRGTWLLGAPLGWGLALLTLQTLLHWFVSQSIFVVEMKVYDKDGSPLLWDSSSGNIDYSQHFSNCGYSPIAIIFSVIAAGVLLLSAIIFCWLRFPEGSPPVVSTCSAAISAACHPVNRTEGMIYGDFRWGVNGGFPNGVGHCSLVPAEAWESGQARAPVHGYTYAGLPETERQYHCAKEDVI